MPGHVIGGAGGFACSPPDSGRQNCLPHLEIRPQSQQSPGWRLRLSAPAVLFLAALPAGAHVISMSTGWATIDGNRVEYILRMPTYEMANVRDPVQTLFDHIRFSSGFETGRRISQECHDDAATASYLCAANYQFSAPVDRLGVDCTFYEVTVPNHIHMLHAERSGKSDQAILDSSFPSATLAFRPPTALERIAEQAGAGALRVWTSWAQVLLLTAIVLASRTRRELLAAGLAFLCGECAGTAVILRAAWQPSARFAEAAAALALAYLALEIVAFPLSRGRWLLALLFGAFEGMYFAVFLADSGYSPGYVLSGASVAAVIVLAAAAVLTRLIGRLHPLAVRACAGALFITGAVWFIVRLRG
jgi:hypothetical protein